MGHLVRNYPINTIRNQFRKVWISKRGCKEVVVEEPMIVVEEKEPNKNEEAKEKCPSENMTRDEQSIVMELEKTQEGGEEVSSQH